ncbi:sodium:proton antiporter [Roseovarius sp. 22II1-1F6A]|nr:MRP family ATP-binding protein [Actibacterium sp.]OWU66919.1 sodium:proton antiporter [Roseovarius sp. 22II1-1F6A]|tara:strand:+ start:658 stop:1755 length:1098 start_codon:yes stop_codon:yes gene_type:complete
MTVKREEILDALSRLKVLGDRDPVSADLIRALSVSPEGAVRFVLEAATAEDAAKLEAQRGAVQQVVEAIPGVTSATVGVSAPMPASGAAQPKGNTPPPDLKIGGHAKPHQGGPAKVPGIDKVIVVGSGKGGVGKSTVSANLAVALARAGRKVGLLDADIYGPSQPRMMGVTKRAASPDGKVIEPSHAHGVTMMSIGLMLDEGQAVAWRGPMLMGALQQLLGQVNWGELDVLIVDLPPGTGDIQISLGQRTQVDGAVVVSTPQDVALIDARRAIDMFAKFKTPVLGLIENMTTYICPNCGHEAHLFGHGGVEEEARKIGVPFLGGLPLALEVREAGDSGRPVAAGDGPVADAYAALARSLIDSGVV